MGTCSLHVADRWESFLEFSWFLCVSGNVAGAVSVKVSVVVAALFSVLSVCGVLARFRGQSLIMCSREEHLKH